jgi:hypothetical protein
MRWAGVPCKAKTPPRATEAALRGPIGNATEVRPVNALSGRGFRPRPCIFRAVRRDTCPKPATYNVIPSIILWRSTNFVFVIDGAHRLSALCAWIQDDYGDGVASKAFYSDDISGEQKRVAARIRKLINAEIGTYASLDGLVGRASSGKGGARAGSMNTRPIVVQTVEDNAKVAEDYKPVSIGARAIVRAWFGHAYWSSFSQAKQQEVVKLAGELHRIMFEPEVSTPLKTLDLPLAGSKSPVDAFGCFDRFFVGRGPEGASG